MTKKLNGLFGILMIASSGIMVYFHTPFAEQLACQIQYAGKCPDTQEKLIGQKFASHVHGNDETGFDGPFTPVLVFLAFVSCGYIFTRKEG